MIKMVLKNKIKETNNIKTKKTSIIEEIKILKELFSKYKAKDLLNIIKNLYEKKSIKESFTIKEHTVLEKLKEGYKKAKKEGFELFTFKETFRFSTRKEISKIRIDTLKKNKCIFESILDSTAGIGLATIFFSNYFKKVYAVEIDILRFLFLKKNLELYNIKNVEAYNYNITSKKAKSIIEKAKILFVDPERIEKNKKRFLEENKPELSFFLNLKKNFLYELSPRIRLEEVYEKLKIFFDKKNIFLELFSKNNRHSRTTLYYFKDKNLNFNIQIKNEFLEEIKGKYKYNLKYDFKKQNNFFEKKFLLDIDTIILKSTLFEEYKKILEKKLEENKKLKEKSEENFFSDDKRLLYFTNNIKENFDKDTKINFYTVKIPFSNIKRIIKVTKNFEELKKTIEKIEDFKRIILKLPIEEKEYYTFVNKIRKSSTGNINVYLYKIKNFYIIAI